VYAQVHYQPMCKVVSEIINGRCTKSITLDTPVLHHGDAVLELFASPLVHCAPKTSGERRPGQKRSAAGPHDAGLAGLYNQLSPCHVIPSNIFGDS